jgi:hypothetical protein
VELAGLEPATSGCDNAGSSSGEAYAVAYGLVAYE